MGDAYQVLDWDEYVGQAKLKAVLEKEIQSVLIDEKNGNDAAMLAPVLLAADPGYGKTTLARIIAHRLRIDFQSFTKPPNYKDFCRFVDRWDGGVLLLDELHRWPKGQQEDLLTMLQDGQQYLELPNGRRIGAAHVTVIAATTERDKLIDPLLEGRFKIEPYFHPYSDGEMQAIVVQMARKVGLPLDPEIALGLAKASGATPRVAVTLVAGAYTVNNIGEKVTVQAVLDHCGLDVDGLNRYHLAYLQTLYDLGGTAGVDKLTAVTRQSASSLRSLERLLLAKNLISFDDRGRELTAAGNRKITGERPRRRIA